MNWKMAENSIFAILLRAPWWASALIAFVVIGLASALLPVQYRVFGWAMALPFIIISGMVLWRMSQAPSRKQIDELAERLRGLNARDFAAELSQGYERIGAQVEAATGPAGNVADLVVTQGWRVRLLNSRRWKAATIGVEPLRQLHEAREKAEATGAIMVALGEVSPPARKFALANRIDILDAAALARLLIKGQRE